MVSAKCTTTEGEDCKFPFTYNSIKYEKCTEVKHTRRWCATELDDANHYKGDWGDCSEDEDCLVGIGFCMHVFPFQRVICKILFRQIFEIFKSHSYILEKNELELFNFQKISNILLYFQLRIIT